MQTPICEVCLNSDMLCNACKQRLESNEISQAEIDICRYIHELSSKAKSLQEVKIEKIIESNSIIIIAAKGDAAKIVGKGGVVVKALAKKFSRSIKVIEQSKDMKEFVQNLIAPANLKGINILFTPKGEVYKLRISSSQRSLVSVKDEDITSITSAMFNHQAEIVFEN